METNGNTRPTVIVGFAEALSAPEVTWSLTDSGFDVVAFTRQGCRPSLRKSRFVRLVEIAAPEEDFRRAAEELESAVAQISETAKRPVGLMPLDDTAVLLCADAKLPHDVVLIGPRGELSQVALDKRRQIRLAEEAGFSVPRSRWFETDGEIPPNDIDFPVIVKPALAMRKRGATVAKGRTWICSDQKEFEAALAASVKDAPTLVQQYVTGEGQGLFGLATPRGVVGWSGHRRLRMMNPNGSGASACTTVRTIDPDCKAAAERFVRACGWSGLFMIEMLREESGKLWFIEFNGRPWGSMALARRIGFEYPAWAAQLALEPEKSIDVPPITDWAPVCRHLGREILYLLFLLRGPQSKAITTWPSIWTGLASVVRTGRNDRWYNWRGDDSGFSATVTSRFVTNWLNRNANGEASSHSLPRPLELVV